MNLANDEGRARLKCWVKFFEHMLGWPEEKTIEWAIEFESELANENSLLFHESDFWHPICELVTPSLRQRLKPLEVLNLIRETDVKINICRKKLGIQSREFWDIAKEIIESQMGVLDS